MLLRPDISDDTIITCLRDSFGLCIAHVAFLPLGWVNNAMYRVTAYYRYERIVVDIAEYAEQIFGMHGSVEERQKGLGLANQFLPNNVVDMAHRSYYKLYPH
jgi:hypothetical protein